MIIIIPFTRVFFRYIQDDIDVSNFLGDIKFPVVSSDYKNNSFLATHRSVSLFYVLGYTSIWQLQDEDNVIIKN